MSNETTQKTIVPALGFHLLTGLYDPIIQLTTREKKFKNIVVSQKKFEAGENILDLACGTGTLTMMLKKNNPDVTLHALDADPDVMSQAQKKAQALNYDIQFKRGFSHQLPYQDSFFDGIFSSLFFHHLNTFEKQDTLKEVHRVLKPGKCFYLADFGKPTHVLTHSGFMIVRLLDGFDVTKDNKTGHLQRMIKEAGFEIQNQHLVDSFVGSIYLTTCKKLS